jgi:phosphoribosylformimino-5-aminoimidazole carboxamide ribotide isomerase
MKLVPAIDLIDGKTVRLRKGDYGQLISYDESPAEAARRFEADGAGMLHVVDLDGARHGRTEQLWVLSEIAAAVSIPVEYGGGLRTLDDLRSAVSVGAVRVVLGTAAVTNPDLVDAAVTEFGESLVVSVDGRNGEVALEGWTEGSGQTTSDTFRRLEAQGVTQFVYSAISRDGTLEGPALDEASDVCGRVNGRVTYAGGIGSVDDLVALAQLGLQRLEGVIIGRALHEGRFSLESAVAAVAEV